MAHVNVNTNVKELGSNDQPANEETFDQLWRDLKSTSSVVPRHIFGLIASEWQLSRTSLLLALMALLIFSGLLVVTWLVICVGLAYTLYMTGLPVSVVLLTTLIMQTILCVMSWKATGYYFRHVGFGQSLALVKAIAG